MKDSRRARGAEILYRATFDNGADNWLMGKDSETVEWHKNILGHFGKGVPLKWSKSGGRKGGFAYSESPWYFDDNHGEFYWLYLIANRRTEGTDVAGRDVRNALVKVSLRGRNLKLKGTKLFFWAEGPSGASDYFGAKYYEAEVYRCWALTLQPLEGSLTDGKWHDVSFKLTPDETLWSYMGLINGGLRKKIRVIQSLTSGEGTLDDMLGNGKLYTWGFILCGIDPLDPPSGKIDLDEFSVSIPSR
jgi:hypothetical protein